MTEFAAVGARYVEQLSRGLALTGERAGYFAQCRIARVNEIANASGITPRVILDFGCGSGAAFASLRAAFGDARIIGFEPERALRAVAESAARQWSVELLDDDALDLHGDADIVYCNGVFHHVRFGDRALAMQRLRASLRPQGLAFVWENSPYNPGTRWVMSRIPFDRDAQLLTPGDLRALQQSAGLAPVATEFHFVFPRPFAFLRGFEPVLRSVPLGGQYVVVGRAA